jgi:hypothetical protein
VSAPRKPRKVVVWMVCVGAQARPAEFRESEQAARVCAAAYEMSGLAARIVRCEGVLRG